ncbi:prepilin peptidase [Vagococcus luciliae]|uniref:Prepilin type IV endopeptidase peptidase domain-containing protein n=1 Tax=Vagococcus luciliae TaxID=2920380 RepID=A0ABY5NYM0_9ENTE|nr:prepilin peptidase [Vagococcus luciliae]UUV98593.1 hypothetical protein G314FT_07460 [Vagococcus luciliae]
MIFFLFINIMSYIFLTYVLFLPTDKKINIFNKHTRYLFFLGSSIIYLLLLTTKLSMVTILLIIMGFYLSIIDLYYYIVDPYLSVLFLIGLLTLYPSINKLLPVCVLLFFLLLSYLMPKKLGFGDIKLLVYWSIFLTPIQLIWLIFIASFIGILYIILYHLLTSNPLIKIAFVPFLTIALTIVLLII